VVRVTQLQPKAVLFYDTVRLREAMIEARELAALIRQGVWTLG
jgi:phage antirepressor YoqD-like protein